MCSWCVEDCTPLMILAAQGISLVYSGDLIQLLERSSFTVSFLFELDNVCSIEQICTKKCVCIYKLDYVYKILLIL